MDALDLNSYLDTIGRPDSAARTSATQRWDELAVTVRGLGRLQELAAWLAGVQGVCPPRPITRPRVVIFAADHGIAAAEVSARRPGATAREVRHVLGGGAAVSLLARRFGAGVRVVDVGVDDDLDGVPADVTAGKVRRGSGRVDQADALTREESDAAFRLGETLADAEIDAGADLLIPGAIGVAGSTPAAVLIGALAGGDAASVTGRGSGIDDAAWMRKCAAIRDALRRARPLVGEPLALAAACGGADLAALTGFLLRAASRRTPVLLDGVSPLAAALLAQRAAFRSPDWWVVAQRPTDPAARKALDLLSLEPLLDTGARQGDGTGALLALPLVTAAAELLADLPTFAAADLPEPLLRSHL